MVENITRLSDFHRSLGPLNDVQLEELEKQPIRPHRFLDANRVREEVLKLPPLVRMGREIYLGGMDEYADDPWHLVTDIDTVFADQNSNGIISMKYDLTITTLQRSAYGGFFADGIHSGEAVNIHRMSDILASWEECRAECDGMLKGTYDEDFLASCNLVDIYRADRFALKRMGNPPIGRSFLLKERGDCPVLITGCSISTNPERKKWHQEVLCFYYQEGCASSFAARISHFTRVPQPESASLLKRQAG